MVLVFAVTLLASSARAQQRSGGQTCQGPKLVLDAALGRDVEWVEAAAKARQSIADLSDVDACTLLEVRNTKRSATLRVLSSDGRSAVRTLADSSELGPTVVALLALPPANASESAALAEPQAEPAAELDDRGAETQSVFPADEAGGVDLALGPSGRMAGGLAGVGANALLDWNLSNWLLGVSLGGAQLDDRSSSMPRLSRQRSLALGAVVGRRLYGLGVTWDVGLEVPLLAIEQNRWSSETPVVGSHSDDDGGEEADGDDASPVTGTTPVETFATYADLRAGALLRASLPFRDSLSVFLALDAQRSLRRWGGRQTDIARAVPPPDYSAGLTIGCLWSQL